VEEIIPSTKQRKWGQMSGRWGPLSGRSGHISADVAKKKEHQLACVEKQF